MTLRNSLFSIFLLFSIVTIAKENERLSDGEIIAGLASYRNNIIRQDEQAYLQMVTAVKELQTWGLNEKDLVALYEAAFNYIYRKIEIPNHIIKQYTQYRNYRGEKLGTKKLEAHLNALGQNFDLLEGILQGLFEVFPPFKLDAECSLFQEIKFYQFEKESHIADIGAGIGTFSFLLAHCLPESQFILTELDLNDLRILRARKKRFAPMIDSNRIEIREGFEQMTGLEQASMNSIILRRTLHHFEQPSAMLRDIHQALKPGGKVLLQEPDGRMNIRKLFTNICSDAMKPHEVRELMHLYGFIKKDQIQMGDYIYFIYEKEAI